MSSFRQKIKKYVMRYLNQEGGWQEQVFLSILALIIPLIIGAFIILSLGYNPIFIYYEVLKGSLGSPSSISNTISKTIPLIMTGLALAIPFRVGLFNIGGEGQIMLGGFAAALAGIYISAPALIHVPIMLIVGMLVGAFWASIAGVLKAYLDAHEVVTTIMLNYIATFLTIYLVNNPFKGKGFEPRTPKINSSAILHQFSEIPLLRRFVSGGGGHVGIFIAILAAIGMYYLLWKTSIGYRLRSVGFSSEASKYGGIDVKKTMVIGMMLGGAMAGLGGSLQTMGLYRSYTQGFSPGWGFDGIAVGALARNHPLGVLLTAGLFGILTAGGNHLDIAIAGLPREIIGILKALVILFVGAPQLMRVIRGKLGGGEE